MENDNASRSVFISYKVAQNRQGDKRVLSFLFVKKENSLERDIYVIFFVNNCYVTCKNALGTVFLILHTETN